MMVYCLTVIYVACCIHGCMIVSLVTFDLKVVCFRKLLTKSFTYLFEVSGFDKYANLLKKKTHGSVLCPICVTLLLQFELSHNSQ